MIKTILFACFFSCCGLLPAQDFPNFVLPGKDTVDKSVRDARNERYNVRLPFSMVEARPRQDNPVRKIFLESQPELPYQTSDTIATGEVTEVRPFFSADRKGLYTEYTIRITEVIKEPSGTGVSPGSFLTLLRGGGSGKLPDGRIVDHIIEGDVKPELHQNYLFFLNSTPNLQAFAYKKFWLIQSGALRPLFTDDVALGANSAIAGKSVVDVITLLKSKVGR